MSRSSQATAPPDRAARRAATVRPATVRDVARVAGVSAAAVTRALNPQRSASSAMRARVQAAVTALGYRPNAIARGLTRGSSGIIAMLVTDPASPFYAALIAAAAQTMQRAGRRLMVVAVTDGNVDRAVADVLAYSIDGLLLAGAELSAASAAACAAERRAVALVNRRARIAGVHSVVCDDHWAGARAAALLLQAGHTRIAYVAGTAESAASRQRQAGLRTALRAAGTDLHTVLRADWTYRGAFDVVAHALAREPAPDALFCANDIMACAAMDAARRHGLRVPEQLSVLGFDDSPQAAWEAYRLTTFRHPVAALAERATAALLDDAPSVSTPVVIRPDLVLRDSLCRPVPQPAGSVRSGARANAA